MLFGRSIFNPVDVQLDLVASELQELSKSVGDVARYCSDRTAITFKEVWKLVPPGFVPDDVATTKAKKCLDALEIEIEKICTTHSWYFWLYLTSRIPSLPRPEMRLGTARQAHDALRAACLKYGNRNIGSDMSRVNFGAGQRSLFSPPTITQQDLEDALCLSNLAYVHAELAGKLRTMWKGAKGVLSDDYELLVPEPREELRRAIEFYQHRRFKPRQGRCFHGTSGIWQERIEMLQSLSAAIHKTGVPEIFSAEPNFERDEMGFFFTSEQGIASALGLSLSCIPNYRVHPIPDKGYLAVLESYWADEIEADLGFAPKELIAFLCAVSRKQAKAAVQDENAIGSRQGLLQKGFFLFQTEDLHLWYRNAWEACFESRLSQEEASEAVERLIQRLTYSNEEMTSIDLWDAIPVTKEGAKQEVEIAKPIYTVPDLGLVFDFAAVCSLLESVLYEIGKRTGEVGKHKGNEFERYLRSYIENNVSNANVWSDRWWFMKNAKETDIDVCVEVGPALWAIECKAHKITRAWERGEKEEVDRREAYWKNEISRHRRRCKYVAENPNKVRLPRKIKYIFCVCCSPFAEYFSKLDRDTLLTGKIPVVGTPEEIVQLIKEYDGPDYLKAPHRFEVSWDTSLGRER